MIREDFLEEGTGDFIQPELSLLLKVLAKASLRQWDCQKGKPGLRTLPRAQALPAPSLKQGGRPDVSPMALGRARECQLLPSRAARIPKLTDLVGGTPDHLALTRVAPRLTDPGQ